MNKPSQFAPAHKTGANATQVAGDHYKRLAIEPWDYAAANFLDGFQLEIIAHVTRYRDKGGIDDLRKARHYVDKLIELNQLGYPARPWSPEMLASLLGTQPQPGEKADQADAETAHSTVRSWASWPILKRDGATAASAATVSPETNAGALLILEQAIDNVCTADDKLAELYDIATRNGAPTRVRGPDQIALAATLSSARTQLENAYNQLQPIVVRIRESRHE